MRNLSLLGIACSVGLLASCATYSPPRDCNALNYSEAATDPAEIAPAANILRKLAEFSAKERETVAEKPNPGRYWGDYVRARALFSDQSFEVVRRYFTAYVKVGKRRTLHNGTIYGQRVENADTDRFLVGLPFINGFRPDLDVNSVSWYWDCNRLVAVDAGESGVTRHYIFEFNEKAYRLNDIVLKLDTPSGCKVASELTRVRWVNRRF